MPLLKDGKIMYTLAEVQGIVNEDGVVHGVLGGLILGNSHADGGIKVIRQYNQERLYEVIAEFEGWEYLLNPATTKKELDFLMHLNSKNTGSNELFTEFEIPRGTDIIDARPVNKRFKETGKLILINEYSQFIVNKHSTKKYLMELDSLNKKHIGW